jgi:gluconokinase
LGVRHTELVDRTRAGDTDEEVLAWAHAHGTPRTDEECHTWNRFLLKLGWRDERSAILAQRVRDSGFTDKIVETIIDHIEYDEGRDPVATRAWDSV